MPEYTMKQYKEKIDRWIKDYPKEAEKTLKIAATIVEGEVHRNHLAGPKMPRGQGSSTRGTLQPGPSAALQNSITSRVNRLGSRLQAAVGNFKHPLKYARIHEYGGVINHPGGTKYLVVGKGMAVFVKKSAMKFTGITKPHQIRIPERSYLRSSLAKKKRQILDLILSAIKRSYNNV
jgi:hypothetical protein